MFSCVYPRGELCSGNLFKQIETKQNHHNYVKTCCGTNVMFPHVLPPDGDSVVIEGGLFSWSHDDSPCLQRINVKVRTGSLVAVVGHIGSGKSSLLSAMLGEMERRRGFVSINVTSFIYRLLFLVS